MTVWQSIRLVAVREFAARKRAFAISTSIIVTIAAGAMALASLATEPSGSTRVTPEDADRAIGFISVVVLFIGIIMTGQVIMEGVAEEKRSRVVEVVLGTMLPRHLLAGKVAAIGLMGLTEIALLCAAVAGAGQAFDVFDIPVGTALGLAFVVLWFVLGFALYSALYGAAGAMVAPHENVSNGAIPINIGLAIPYMVAVATGPQGDNALLQVLSIFPLSAPLTMPLRTIRDFAAPWEIALSLTLTVAATYLLIRLAGRLYTGAVMRGGKVRWREAWRTAAHVE